MMYAAGFGTLAIVTYNLPISGQFKIVLPAIFSITGVAFIFLRLEERAWDAYHYYRGVRKAKPEDPRAQRLVGIKAIENNAVYLSGNGLRTVLQVEPVNYSLLEESQRKALILSYREFLNHLTTPIQIVVKTSRANLDSYFEKTQERLQGNSSEMNKIFEDFMVYEQDFLRRNNVRERRFYLVACSQPRSLINNATSKNSKELKELEEKTKIIQEKLLACGLKSRRLENNELKHFFATYSSQEADSSEDATDEKEKTQDQTNTIYSGSTNSKA